MEVETLRHLVSVRGLAAGLAVILLETLAACGQRQPQPFDTGVIVMIGGDTHFGENYAHTAPQSSAAARLSDDQRYRSSLEALKPIVDRSEFAFVNLEAPMSPQLSDELTDKDYVHWSDCTKALPALVAAGIDAVGLGNNHSFDQGELGLRKSLVALERAGIRSFGAGTSQRTAVAPLLQVIRRPGGGEVTLAIFGMLEERQAYRDKYGFYAGQDKAGVAPIDLQNFQQQVSALRARTKDLFVIAYPHWGENYSWASHGQVKLGRDLIDAGADIVIGQHAHNLQEIERYQGRWILYGIGNFNFLSPGRYDKFAKVQPFSLIVGLSFGSDAHAPPAVRLYPILSDNRSTAFRPVPANATQATAVISAIESRKKSIGFNAQVRLDDAFSPAIELRKRQWAGIW